MATASKPGVDERTEVFVAAISLTPKLEEFTEDRAGHFECAPNPIGRRSPLLHLDFGNGAVFGGHDGIEKFGMIHREQKERKNTIRKSAQAVVGKPNSIGQTEHGVLVRMD